MHQKINLFLLIVFFISNSVDCLDHKPGINLRRNTDHHQNYNTGHNLQPQQQQNYLNPKAPELIGLIPNQHLQNNSLHPENNQPNYNSGNQNIPNHDNLLRNPNNNADTLINNSVPNQNSNQQHPIHNPNIDFNHRPQPNQHPALQNSINLNPQVHQQEAIPSAPKGRSFGLIQSKINGETDIEQSQFKNLIEDDVKSRFIGNTNEQHVNQQINENLESRFFDQSNQKKCILIDCTDQNTPLDQTDLRLNSSNDLLKFDKNLPNINRQIDSKEQIDSNKSNSKPDTKSDTIPDTKPDTKSDTKSATKSDTEPDTKSKLNRFINFNPIPNLPVVFNKDYSLSTFNDSIYLKQKLSQIRNSLYKTFNNSSSHSTAVTNTVSSVAGFIGQIKMAKLSLINSIVGLNAFGVKDEQTSSVCSIANRDLFVSSGSHTVSMLCMSTVCIPSSVVDIVNNYEFAQCALSCLMNARSAIALYVYKNYNNLSENLKFKSEFTSKLQTTLTSSLVTEGIDYLIKPNSGLNVEQVSELQTFKKTFLSHSSIP